MRLWPLTLMRPRPPRAATSDQRILPMDEREAELLRRHRSGKPPKEKP